MKKQELQGAFSQMRAPDACVEKVLAAQAGREAAKRRNVARRIVAAAAALAIFVGCWLFWPAGEEVQTGGILVVPGVLKVYAAERELTENPDVVYYAPIGGGVSSEMAVWAPFTNVAGFGIPLTFCVPESLWGDVEITFDVSAEHGYFLDQKMNPKNLGSDVSLDNREKVYWRGSSIFHIADVVGENGLFYLDVIIRADGRIVGCGVISIVYKEYYCLAYSLETVGYPLVDGAYQDITEAFVLEQIENMK